MSLLAKTSPMGVQFYSTQQRGLCQLSSQVDSCHGNYMECRSELGALQGERERLEAERLRLSERISEIDKDLTQVL